jgi:oxygen-independent coproporphyrinogen III oxidase
VLDEEDVVLRRHILNLMTRFETDWSDAAEYVPYLDTVASKLVEPRLDGLVRLRGKRCEITPDGKGFLRNICMAFDARLARKADNSHQFSRTV